MGLALADALHFGGVQRVNLAPALMLLLLAKSVSSEQNHDSILQGIPFRRTAFQQNRLLRPAASRFQIKGLGVLHGRLIHERFG
jgi:hypothetical protein